MHGKITHTGTLARHNGKLHLGYGQEFKIGNGYNETGQQMELEPKGEECEFKISSLYAVPVGIELQHKRIKLETADLPKTDLVIDLP